MRTVVLGLGVAALLAASPALHALDRLTLEIDGVERVARVHAPKRETRTPPLVIIFHGVGDTARNFDQAVEFHEAWPEAVVAYPEGQPRADRDGMRGWHGMPENDANNDLAFVEALVAALQERYGADPSRTFAAGFSNGGHLTFNLLRQRPCLFAAFAPVGALGPYVADAPLPRPVIYLFGRGEPREYREDWAKTVVTLARVNRTRGEPGAWDDELQRLDGEAPLVWGTYNAGHVWPYGGNEVIVRFFKEEAAGCPDAGGSRQAPLPNNP